MIDQKNQNIQIHRNPVKQNISNTRYVNFKKKKQKQKQILKTINNSALILVTCKQNQKQKKYSPQTETGEKKKTSGKLQRKNYKQK